MSHSLRIIHKILIEQHPQFSRYCCWCRSRYAFNELENTVIFLYVDRRWRANTALFFQSVCLWTFLGMICTDVDGISSQYFAYYGPRAIALLKIVLVTNSRMIFSISDTIFRASNSIQNLTGDAFSWLREHYGSRQMIWFSREILALEARTRERKGRTRRIKRPLGYFLLHDHPSSF